MDCPRILIIDDEPDIRELLEITLGRMNMDTFSAGSIFDAEAALQNPHFDLCLTDMKLPDGSGIDLVRFIQKHCPQTPVAVITAYGSMDTAISALKAGAFDFVSKPIDLPTLRDLVHQALKLSQKPKTQNSFSSKSELLGADSSIVKLKKQIHKIARNQAPIFISGESGTGKEVVARMIHEQGSRHDQSFIPVNCGAIPAELMESEFFGHCKGSFTGAVRDKIGLFQAASGGTLFLDEIADLPLHMQVKLLRAIQEKKVRPVGSQQEVPVDVRILSATHKDLVKEIQRERFRQDLYYRVNVIELKIPPLRNRGEDVLRLAEHILNRLTVDYGCAPADMPMLSQCACEALRSYCYPGNVRELENILERAFTLCENKKIYASDLHLPTTQVQEDTGEISPPPKLRDTPPKVKPELSTPSPESINNLEDYLKGMEKQVLLQVLEKKRWNRTAAAKQLGISFRALRYKLKKLGLDGSDANA
ncbi:sigma-54 dependent transcriptional regulator [Sansalvadorimonas sp. 2012CJ34-2]|uniref:Sigma-54 dependent transcriptional regulator n=1 Tax=Parendozoicomonas callyspongiae TaxID=2942213 RepID=A0ABT0PE39_9GAMM|nr:sigma-54 dependent transcriptional regulator [Sansalvadorimonas sp. 2012CJ34-2]MCL6269491.1 sigma-54 dependent transcriptional regulator [Sansalvadorimonas sp. 2012CJ34-2]